MYEFTANDQKIYRIDLDDGEKIRVFNSANAEVGSITLRCIEGDTPEQESFHVLDLALGGCKRLGIGTEVFRLHNKHFGSPITAASAFGQRMDDGSHLIDDGIPFVARMRRLGLICPEPGDDEGSDDDD